MMKKPQLGALACSTLLLALAGCAAAGGAGAGPVLPEDGPARSEAPIGEHGIVMKAADIARLENAVTAMDVVRRLRPELLTRRGGSTLTAPFGNYPTVYVNRMYQGGLDHLQTIPAGSIVEIRYLRAVAAADWLGRVHPGGVIAVTTRN